MADTAGSALTDGGTPIGTDILIGVDDPGGSPASRKYTLANVASYVDSAIAGKQAFWVPASHMRTRATSGATPATTELANTADVNIDTMNFPSDADTFAQFTVVFGSNWNAGTVSCQFYYSTDGSQTAGEDGVQFYIQGYAYGDSDDIDVAAFGTAVTYGSPTPDDHSGTQDDVAITAETNPCTIGGTPAAGDMCIFQIYHDVSAGDLTSTTPARLHGVMLYYTTTSMTVA